MTRAIGFPESRRARVLLCAVLAAAVALTLFLVVRWERSEGHRAQQIADSFRAMPGVASAHTDGDSGPRDLTVRLSSTASRIELQDVYDRRENLPSDLIDRMTVTVGAVSSELDDTLGGGSTDDVALQWALRGMRGGSVELSAYSQQVRLRATKEPAVAVAREAVAALDIRGFQKVDLLVYGGDGTKVTVAKDVALPAAHAVLGDIAPFAPYLTDSSVYPGGVNLDLRAGHTDRMAKVAATAQRAARRIRAAGDGDDDTYSFTVRDQGSGRMINGDPDTDLAASQRVTTTLEQKGWTVGSVQADLSGVAIKKESAAAANLPQLQRDLAALRPALPKNAVITLSEPDQDRLNVFSGTMTELRRVTPKLMALEHAGYRIYWDIDGLSSDISVLLPKGAQLGPDSIREAGRRLRAIGWTGSATIVIQQRSRNDEDDYFPAYITFPSTDTGTAGQLRVEPRDASITVADATRAWNASATK
ncbi:MAG TPA: hypothetical protein VG502_02000 [Flexivirga sp.]|uniref:hypothetical protein n=1 Tax=Flexivirga sp. TaxID=1962927 RepID=UPI002C39F278|nr:hypothetical protein [Flexivirga sp.]HWC21049.1 hypothetical protein [Flexivirga sp.]